MFTEKSLRDNAHLVKALMGIAAEDFYQMLAQIEQRLPLYEQHRLQRETRQRALGGGAQFWIVTNHSGGLSPELFTLACAAERGGCTLGLQVTCA
jgi:sulfur transfer protein SufE